EDMVTHNLTEKADNHLETANKEVPGHPCRVVKTVFNSLQQPTCGLYPS
ncbi:hypothetical protein GWI33_011176, partial [Rhynchophorus ferrugineus]